VVRIVDLLGENLKIPYKATVCVLNDYAKANILSCNENLNERDVVVTGQPNIEPTYTEKHFEDFIKRYNLDKFDKVISFFSQPNIAYREDILVEFIKLMQKRPNFMVYGKPIPTSKWTYIPGI